MNWNIELTTLELSEPVHPTQEGWRTYRKALLKACGVHPLRAFWWSICGRVKWHLYGKRRYLKLAQKVAL